MPTWPSPRSEQLGTPNPPRNPFHAGQVFRGFPIHAFATACQVARSPVRIRPTRSALESFYFQASNGSVALPVAGYDYNSDWTPLLAGLSPARMAASLAAPDPYNHFKHQHGSTEVDAVAKAQQARTDRSLADYLQNIGWKLTDSAEREIERDRKS